jgi:uncharacterized membrane protein
LKFAFSFEENNYQEVKIFMASSTKRQAFVAFTVLFLMMGIIAYFLYNIKPIVKIVPVDQAMQSVEAERRSKELEAKLLNSFETSDQAKTDTVQK